MLVGIFISAGYVEPFDEGRLNSGTNLLAACFAVRTNY